MNKNYYDDEYTETNRDRKMKPKRGFGFCVCDMVLIGDWSKCPICGCRNGRKRLKR